MKHFLFIDHGSGEEFIVGENTIEKAKEIAAEYFDRPCYLYQLNEFEAEESGLDEY